MDDAGDHQAAHPLMKEKRAMTPAEIEDRLLKAEAQATVLTMLMGEFLAALPDDLRERIGAAMDAVVRELGAATAQPLAPGPEALGLHMAAFMTAIRKQAAAPFLSTLDPANLRPIGPGPVPPV
jgi:hypothetical protein